MRARSAAGVGAAALVAGVGAAAALGFGGTGDPAPASDGAPPATAAVTRGTLTETEDVSGTLGFGDQTAVLGRGSGGTVTWLAGEGATVRRGAPVYEVDNDPVVLLYAGKPFYRTLRSGDSGSDVKALEANLAALGYTGFTADDDYTAATADAVRRWQEDLGVPETGTVEPARVVVARSEIRVAQWKAVVGGPAGGQVLTYTGTTRVVTVALDVADQQLVRAGTTATVTLPDDKRVPGRVAAVGRVATKATTGSGAGQSSSTTIDVTITIADQRALGSLDEAPVDVTLVSQQRKDVLTVPVGALVALREGGYGVQVVDGAGTRYAPVTTGLFADGRVEVTGVDEGATVVVPK